MIKSTNSAARALLGAFAVTMMLSAMPAEAANFPSKPIWMIVPFAPGGGTDTMARIYAEKMEMELGQSVVVENKAGAATIIGTNAVAKSRADGYTIWFGPSTSFITNQFFYPNLPYNPQRDLKLVYQIAKTPQVLVVHASVPANNAKELLEYVKANKSELNYGSYGAGTYPHLAGAYMSQKQGADMNHISYKGEAPMLVGLMTGDVQMAYAGFLGIKPHVESGKIKAIGVIGEQRSKVMPDLPTLKEQGVDTETYRVVPWVGVAVPAATPDAVVQRIQEAVRKAANDPDVERRIGEMGFDVIKDSSPEKFQAAYQHDLPIWKRFLEQSGARLE